MKVPASSSPIKPALPVGRKQSGLQPWILLGMIALTFAVLAAAIISKRNQQTPAPSAPAGGPALGDPKTDAIVRPSAAPKTDKAAKRQGDKATDSVSPSPLVPSSSSEGDASGAVAGSKRGDKYPIEQPTTRDEAETPGVARFTGRIEPNLDQKNELAEPGLY